MYVLFDRAVMVAVYGGVQCVGVKWRVNTPTFA